MQVPARAAHPSEDPVVLAITTLGRNVDAASFARTLVSQRLVACANVLPGVRSTYRWQGEIVVDEEQLVLLKLSRSRLAALKEVLPSLHPYDVPELIVLDVTDGLPSYLAWIGASTSS